MLRWVEFYKQIKINETPGFDAKHLVTFASGQINAQKHMKIGLANQFGAGCGETHVFLSKPHVMSAELLPTGFVSRFNRFGARVECVSQHVARCFPYMPSGSTITSNCFGLCEFMLLHVSTRFNRQCEVVNNGFQTCPFDM
jgi:hypothetical protein